LVVVVVLVAEPLPVVRVVVAAGASPPELVKVLVEADVPVAGTASTTGVTGVVGSTKGLSDTVDK
jgi:hypothetical protein